MAVIAVRATAETDLNPVGPMAKVTQLVYGALEPKSGAIESATRAHESPGLNHAFDVVGGVLGDECGEIIQAFFRERR